MMCLANSYQKNYVVIVRSFQLVVRQVILINFRLEVPRSLASSYVLLASANSYQKNYVMMVRSLQLVGASSDLNQLPS